MLAEAAFLYKLKNFTEAPARQPCRPMFKSQYHPTNACPASPCISEAVGEPHRLTVLPACCSPYCWKEYCTVALKVAVVSPQCQYST